MNEQTVRALARVNKLLYMTLVNAGHDVSDTRRGKYQTMPALGFTEMSREIAAYSLMTDDVADMMGALLEDVDTSDITRADEAIPVILQGSYILEWVHQIDFDVVTVKEAAFMLGVSTQRVYKMLKDGKARGVTLRGQKMVFTFSIESEKERGWRIARNLARELH